MVTIGGDSFEGIPSVVFDFYAGMRQQMLHLVDRHGYRRIAFIRGLAGKDEAEQRFQAYHDVMTERGIGVDPRLVVDGSFLRESGKRGVSVLFDERGGNLDAIVAVNDEAALGAFEELAARKIRVPEDVALVGFDDDDAGRWTNPPLTTVRFCIDTAAEHAVGMALAELGRGSSESDIEIPRARTHRQSFVWVLVSPHRGTNARFTRRACARSLLPKGRAFARGLGPAVACHGRGVARGGFTTRSRAI